MMLANVQNALYIPVPYRPELHVTFASFIACGLPRLSWAAADMLFIGPIKRFIIRKHLAAKLLTSLLCLPPIGIQGNMLNVILSAVGHLESTHSAAGFKLRPS
jgi:hypothetical protein